MKTPEKLVDIYYSSVGRNSMLLLNIPPDTRGRISDNDAASLLGMRKILEATFRTNLASGAAVQATSEAKGHGPAALLDGDKDTFFNHLGITGRWSLSPESTRAEGLVVRI